MTAALLERWNGLAVRLRRHPIPIEAHLEHCLTLTYAFHPKVLRPLLPPGLELDTVDGCGFLAIALVQARPLRPAGLPSVVGQDFFLSGRPLLVSVEVDRVSFFDPPPFEGHEPILAAAFHVSAIDYRWERGVRYRAKPTVEEVAR